MKSCFFYQVYDYKMLANYVAIADAKYENWKMCSFIGSASWMEYGLRWATTYCGNGRNIIHVNFFLSLTLCFALFTIQFIVIQTCFVTYVTWNDRKFKLLLLDAGCRNLISSFRLPNIWKTGRTRRSTKKITN